VNGWLAKVAVLKPDKRTPAEIYAVRVSSAAEAIAKVESLRGKSDPPARTVCHISEEVLAGLGLDQDGQAARIRRS
jgi:hypothetical protein